MGGKILQVLAGSIAEELGLEAGDELLEINGEPLRDLIDYNFYNEDEYLVLTVRKPNGEIWDCEVEKYAEEDLGLCFDSSVFDGIRRCANRCLFCFIDQLPPNPRPSLLVKDDDFRMSFLQGNYITCTNMREEDFRRIGEQHLSPLYISVHCVDPILRQKLLGRKKPAEILLTMQRLIAMGCTLHAQIVLCPGLNDGQVLDDTLDSLTGLAAKNGRPGVESVAVVPVGITAYQQHAELRGFTAAEAAAVIDNIEQRQSACRERLGRNFVFASDELYLLAQRPFPPAELYGDFSQIEDGVGMAALFLRQWEELKNDLPSFVPRGRIALVSGKSGAAVVRPLYEELRRRGLDIALEVVPSRWFGGEVSVTGLVTGSDIVAAIPPGKYDRIHIPDNMLKFDADVFLDDMTVDELSRRLNCEVRVAEANPAALLAAVYGEGAEPEADVE